MGKRRTKQKDKHQIETERASIMSILKLIRDGKEHRYKEIKKATGLSDPTLTKFLNRFVDLKLMTRRWDFSTYPHARYYKAEPDLVILSHTQLDTEKDSQLIEKLLESKNPLAVLGWIQAKAFYNIIAILKQFKKNKKLLEPKLNFLMEILVWEPYKTLTWKFMESTMKVIDEIDIEKLEKRQSEQLEQLRRIAQSVKSSGE